MKAAVDWPTAAYYKDLMTIYREAKVILVVHVPDSWHRSIMTTLYQARRAFVVQFTPIVPTLHQLLTAMEHAIWQRVFQNKLEEKAHATIEEVKRNVPAEPLCPFLNVPVPVNKLYAHKYKGTLVR